MSILPCSSRFGVVASRWFAACSLALAVPSRAQEREGDAEANARAVQAATGSSRTTPTFPPERREHGEVGPPLLESSWLTFYPPTPPWYGGVLPETPRSGATANGRPLIAPEELADFVGETFYPALATRLFNGSVGRKMEARLEAYRRRRLELLDELIGELRRGQNMARLQRDAALREFAPRQEARIAALESEAEQLRRDLVAGGFLLARLDGTAGRRWRLGSPEVSTAPVKHDAEHHVAKAAAFFEEGLTIEQRGLLRECAMEAGRAARVSRGRRGLADDDPTAMFFAPETARVRLPSPLPPDVFARLGWFNSEKAGLKEELLQALAACEGLPAEKRTVRFRALATAQRPRLAALEQEAEELRRAIEPLGDAPPPWVPPIPPELRTRIEGYNRDRQALLAAYMGVQREAAEAEARALRGAAAGGGRGASVDLSSGPRAQAAREAARLFEEQNAELIAQLMRRYERIRSDLGDVARDVKDRRTQRSMTIESLLEAYRVAMQRFDTIGREEAMYEHYKHAMLQPGLSPGQRRLLFRAAHAALAQELPRGELMLPSRLLPRLVY